MHILHLDTSPRVEQSHSRRLAKEFVRQWRSHHPEASVTYRDLGQYPIPYIDATWVAAKFALPDQYTPEMPQRSRFQIN